MILQVKGDRHIAGTYMAVREDAIWLPSNLDLVVNMYEISNDYHKLQKNCAACSFYSSTNTIWLLI